MKLLRILPCITTACLAVAACTSTESQPPAYGNCTADAGCSPVAGGGAGGTTGQGEGGAEAAASCTVDSTASQCDQCAEGKCCTSLTACSSSADCRQLLTCAINCPTTDCVTACKQQFPFGVQAYQSLQSCLQLSCPICSESGVGDPCPSRTCVAGLACQGLWCTNPCTTDSDCTGIGPKGANVIGQTNVCVSTASGPRCAPGCNVNADCSSFPGTFCSSTLSFENANVQVCASLVDASAD